MNHSVASLQDLGTLNIKTVPSKDGQHVGVDGAVASNNIVDTTVTTAQGVKKNKPWKARQQNGYATKQDTQREQPQQNKAQNMEDANTPNDNVAEVLQKIEQARHTARSARNPRLPSLTDFILMLGDHEFSFLMTNPAKLDLFIKAQERENMFFQMAWSGGDEYMLALFLQQGRSRDAVIQTKINTGITSAVQNNAKQNKENTERRLAGYVKRIADLETELAKYVKPACEDSGVAEGNELPQPTALRVLSESDGSAQAQEIPSAGSLLDHQ